MAEARTHYSPEHIKGLEAEARRLADLIRNERIQFCPEPHALEGGPLLIWQRLNTAQAMVRRAAELLIQAADPATFKAIDPDEMAELETMLGFTQAADEAASGSQAIAGWNGLVLHKDGTITGTPLEAAQGPAWEWKTDDAEVTVEIETTDAASLGTWEDVGPTDGGVTLAPGSPWADPAADVAGDVREAKVKHHAEGEGVFDDHD